MKYSKVRDVKDLNRGTQLSAGIDFFVPNDWNNGEKFLLHGHCDILIPSGIHVEVPKGYALIAFNKSGIATKMKLDILACVTENTKIQTNIGLIEVKKLTKDFVNKNNIKILSYNNDGNIVESNFDGFRISNNTNCIKLIFDNGYELSCSNDHKILTKNGWKQAQDINEHDEIIKI